IALEFQEPERLGALMAEQNRPIGSRSSTFVAPMDEWEQCIAQIWEEVLDVENVGATDSFFDVGGASLLAVRGVSLLERQPGRHLSLAGLLQSPTVRQLASLLQGAEEEPEFTSLVPVQPGGTKPPLYCVHAAGANVLFYKDLARHLGPDQPVYGIQ